MIDKGNTMTNYDMDELRRREQEKVEQNLARGADWPKSITLGKEEEPHTAIDVEISDEDFVRIAHEAHTRDITINKMVNIILKKSLKDLSYRYEHNNEPQLLNEDN